MKICGTRPAAQQVSEEALQQIKQDMNLSFEAHEVKPGDPGYVYNLQKDFLVKVDGPCDWDDDSDSASLDQGASRDPQVQWETILQETKVPG